MADKETFNLTKFDGTNFTVWKYGVSFLLDSQDLMEYVLGSDKKPVTEKESKEWKSKQSKAVVMLLSSVEKSLHVNLINCSTAKGIWEKLHTLYGETNEDAKHQCWQQFYDFRIEESSTISTKVEELETICKKLSDAGDKPSDLAIMSKLLNCLPPKYSAFTMAWECTPKDEKKKETLISRLIREERRLVKADDETTSLALQAKFWQNRFKDKTNAGGKTPSSKKDVPNKVEELKKVRPCNYCHKVGHWYRECRKRKADKQKQEKKESEDVTAYECNISVFYTRTEDADGSIWIADSGASMHMTHNQNLFSEINQTHQMDVVKVASDKVLQVKGIGNVNVQAFTNGKWQNRQLTNVLLVPELKRNLFSIGAVNDKGLSFHCYKE